MAILDIKMQKMSGFELYHSIKKIDNRVVACFLTAIGTDLLLQHYESNCDMVIQKPISNNDLFQEISKRI